MDNILTASIGRKLIMSVTGLFLVSFIAVHLTINLLLIFDDSGELFNLGANFMTTNPVVRIIEPLLGLGFLVHILWSLVITYQNWKARPVRYSKTNSSESSTWASRNMFILGGLVLVFLVIHIINFFWIVKLEPHTMQSVTIGGVEMKDTYTLVADLFKGSIVYCMFYILGGLLLGLHLSHGFWSAFQSLGFNNKYWLKRWQIIGYMYAAVVAFGFSVIPLYFIIKF